MLVDGLCMRRCLAARLRLLRHAGLREPCRRPDRKIQGHGHKDREADANAADQEKSRRKAPKCCAERVGGVQPPNVKAHVPLMLDHELAEGRKRGTHQAGRDEQCAYRKQIP